MRTAAPNRSREDIRVDDFLRSSKRLVADDAPSPDGTVILNGQLGFDQRDTVEKIAAHWRVSCLAKLLSGSRGQGLIEQAQVRVQNVARLRGTSLRLFKYPLERCRFPELRKQRLGEAGGMIQPFGDQFARRRLPRDLKDEVAGGRIVGRTAKYRHMRLELDSVEPCRQVKNNRTQPRSERFAGNQPQRIFGVGDRSSLIDSVGQPADPVAGEGGFVARAIAANATGTHP